MLARPVVRSRGRLEKMWIPKSEQDILSAIDAGDLVETANFDAKSALPAKGKSKDLAVDVAAMSADGGTLLYGVGEDENDRLTVPQPFELAGARERVDQIVRTSISEPPPSRYTRSRRTMIRVLAISWSMCLRRLAPRTWSRWARSIGTTGAVLLATHYFRRGKWPAFTSVGSGGR